MLAFFTQLPDLALFLLLIVAAIIISFLAISLVKRFIPHELRFRDNPVIGNMVGLISIIYGVLAGLTALYLVNNISYANQSTQAEANAVASIFHTSQWLKGDTRLQIQAELMKYLNEVIEREWPLMKQGKTIDTFGTNNIHNMSVALRKYHVNSFLDSLLVHNMITNIQSLYEARQDRIAASEASLSMDIWIVILLGTVLTIVMNYLFAMNFYIHVVTASAAALMCFGMIFLLITLDHPFQGDFILEPEVYKPLLHRIHDDLANK